MEDRSVMINLTMYIVHEHDDHGHKHDDQYPLIPNQSQDREISTYLDPNVSVTPMAESHRSMGDTVYF